MPTILLDLNDRRPAWSPPAWVVEEIHNAVPRGWTLRVMEREADGSGDGASTVDPGLLEAVAQAEIYLGFGVAPALIPAGKKLRWAHTATAGVGRSLAEEMLGSPVLFTNSKGIHGPPMGETAMGMILYFARGLDFGVRNQARGEWNTHPYYREDHPLTEVSRSTVGVFGFGGVGREVARRAVDLGARILAYDRSPEAFLDTGRFPLGDPVDLEDPRLETLHGSQGFRRLLRESDFLVLTAPDTPETRGSIDASALREMKASGVLINLSRGALVDEAALVEALEAGRLRGAGLDVFQEEPLPPGHPLWTLPNVLMTPHVSAVTHGFWRRQTDLILENLRRYLAGEELVNLVDKEAGF